jgi:tetratricopeptide (TPR) repeat protein
MKTPSCQNYQQHLTRRNAHKSVFLLRTPELLIEWCQWQFSKKVSQNCSLLYLEGICHLQRQDKNETLRCLNKAIEEGYSTSNVRLARALCHYLWDDDESALADLESILTVEPLSIKANWLKALMHFYRGQVNETCLCINKILAVAGSKSKKAPLKPLVPLAMHIGELLIETTNLDDLLKNLSLSWRGYCFVSHVKNVQKQFKEGIEYANRALSLCNAFPRAQAICHVEKSFGFIGLRQFENALAEAQAAVSLDSDSVDARANRACVYLLLDRPQESLADYSWVIEKRTHNDVCWELETGTCYLLLGRYGEAVTELTTAINNFPNTARSLFIRSVAHLKIGRVTEAIQDLTKYIEMEPDNCLAYKLRADIYQYLSQQDLLRAGSSDDQSIHEWTMDAHFPYYAHLDRTKELLSFVRNLVENFTPAKYKNREK